MKTKTVFYCTECGNETPKWQGKCPACGAWNTIVEQKAPVSAKKSGFSSVSVGFAASKAMPLSDVDHTEETRFPTGFGELDRVLGGGAVRGELVLVGGAPGVGKSTLLTQICGRLSSKFKTLYVTGEESPKQLKMRAERLGATGECLYVLAETNLRSILDSAESLSPDILIVDSIQTLYNEELDSAPGSVPQVKDCTLALMQLAKGSGITVFVVGHINKDGAIAGPKVLEHMVDCVLYFEGERAQSYRILRAAKNRFGSTNEIGVFEMSDSGLREVPNPSEMLLSGRPKNSAGTCVTCVMEGTRPILAEIQALVTQSSFNVPRRNSNGIDYNRAMLLLAVLEKRGTLNVAGCDAYINVIGGLQLDEPAADLATVMAIASSFRNCAVPDDLAAIGEVGLTGELRAVSSISQRLSEIARLGFKRCLMPAYEKNPPAAPNGLELIMVRSIKEALVYLFA